MFLLFYSFRRNQLPIQTRHDDAHISDNISYTFTSLGRAELRTRNYRENNAPQSKSNIPRRTR